MNENILGKRMKSLRERKDLKQNQVAQKLGVSPYQLSRYESGKTKPDPEMIASIANYYNVTTDYLLGQTNIPTSSESIVRYDKSFFMSKIATEFPDIDLMFKDMESLTAEEMKDVYEYIKFRMSQKKEE